MFRFVSIFLVTAIAAAGYFFYVGTSIPFFNQDLNSEKSNLKNSTNAKPSSLKQSLPEADQKINQQPSIEMINTQPVLQLPVLTAQEKKQAQAHVKSITTSPEEPIAIKSADHFVTADQILQLPELLKPEIVKIESTNPVVAVIVSAAKKENTALSVAQTNQNNANAAQSFAIKIPSFKKTIVTAKPDQAIVTKPVTLKKTTTANVLPSKEKKALNNTAQKTNTVKVLATVTGKIAAPITPVKININSPKVTPVILEAAPIFKKLKENVAEISDMNVSELTKLVADTPKSAGNTTAVNVIAFTNPANPTSTLEPSILAVQSPNTVVANIKDSSPTTATISIVDTTDVKLAIIKPSIKEKKAATVKPQTIVEKPVEKIVVTQSEKNRIKLKELLSETDSDKKRIFYLHAVNNADEQGIWGIIQKGLMGTFSKGINLKQANGTIRALIPEDADEILTSKQSSFLGKLLSYKVLTTYVYNYEQGNIGKNPDFIKPGQQLIIVTFTEQELMGVYQHFKNSQESQ